MPHFLCGDDPIRDCSFEDRRQSIRDQLEFLASMFAIDDLTYTVASNHQYASTSHLVSLLERMAVTVEGCCDVVQNLGKHLKRAAVRSEINVQESTRRGLCSTHATGVRYSQKPAADSETTLS